MTRADRLVFLAFAAIQLALYFFVTVNMRAIASANYGLTIASDLFVASINFWIIRRVAETKSPWAFAGYVLGGALGSVAAIWVTT